MNIIHYKRPSWTRAHLEKSISRFTMNIILVRPRAVMNMAAGGGGGGGGGDLEENRSRFGMTIIMVRPRGVLYKGVIRGK